MILRHLIGLAIALALTWMIFFGAGYFGAVWTHYFADEPEPSNTGEVSVKIIQTPHGYIGLAAPPAQRPNSVNCPAGKTCPPAAPHE